MGRKWRTPADKPIAVEGELTGDGRYIDRDALDWDEGPWPLIFDMDEGDHSGTVIGFVSRIWREADGDRNLIHAEGEFSDTQHPDVQAKIERAAELLDEGAVGVSVRLDSEVIEIRVDEEVLDQIEEEMAALEALFASVVGSSDLPVAARDAAWDGSAAASRVFDMCTDGDSVDTDCVARAFLWRDPDGDPATQAAYSLGFADVVEGQLEIIPAGIAAAAGGRGVDALEGVSDEDRAAIKRKICAVYNTVRNAYDDWPECPFADSMADEPDDEEELAAEPEAADQPEPPEREIADDGRVVVARWSVNDEIEATTYARIRHLAIVDTAAFADGKIENVPEDGAEPEPEPVAASLVQHTGHATWSIRHGQRVEAVETASGYWRIRPLLADRTEGALIAAAYTDDLDAFRDPRFGRSDADDDRLIYQAPERPDEGSSYGCPLTVTDDGRVFGHAALWNRCHAGFQNQCVRPPRGGGYERFLSGAAIPGLPTGPITLSTTHPSTLNTRPEAAMRHYSNTGNAVADVVIGDDIHGIWVAGRIRAGASDEDIAALRGSSLSADWRPIGGQLRLVGLLAVNNPGFLVARQQQHALAASYVDGDLGPFITVGPCDCNSEIAALVAAATNFTSGVVALLPSESDAERLAQDGYEPADAIHLTSAFLGPAEDIDDQTRSDVLEAASAFADATSAITAEAFGTALFNPDSDEAASVLLVQADPLSSVRETFAGWDASDHPQWFPHVTIGYNVEPDAVDMTALTGEIVFDRLMVAFADDATVFDLQTESVQDDANDTAAIGGVTLANLDARVRNLEAVTGGWMLRELERVAPND